MYDNKGKIVLITGGLGGIGSEICKAFLKDDVAVSIENVKNS